MTIVFLRKLACRSVVIFKLRECVGFEIISTAPSFIVQLSFSTATVGRVAQIEIPRLRSSFAGDQTTAWQAELHP
jgi:hypothetical protein